MVKWNYGIIPFYHSDSVLCEGREKNLVELRHSASTGSFAQIKIGAQDDIRQCMSGHSKWAQIKHKKGAADQKRGSLFSKLTNTITVAARRSGGDPDMNFKLRLTIDKARQANMPKENIERAIKRGTGELASVNLEEITYEGFGPGKVAIIIECLTDNKNRTAAEIKHILGKHGGLIAGPGAVAWMFKKYGVITISVAPTFRSERSDQLGPKTSATSNLEELELKLIEWGASDIKVNNDRILVYTKPEDLQKVKENLDKENIPVESAEIEFVAKEKVEVGNEMKEKLKKLFEELDENDGVSNYYTNLK